MKKGILVCVVATAGGLLAQAPALAAGNPILGSVELTPATAAERDAGVWIDGQYMGHLQELDGKDRLVLLPGEHELVIKLVGYEDVRERIVVEPGQAREYRVSLTQDPNAAYPDESQTAKLRIDVSPETAAVFVNDNFVGHVDRFNGRKGARLGAGTYRIKIALPGYQSFETELTLRANQSYEIKTELAKGSITEQSEVLTVGRLAE